MRSCVSSDLMCSGLEVFSEDESLVGDADMTDYARVSVLRPARCGVCCDCFAES